MTQNTSGTKFFIQSFLVGLLSGLAAFFFLPLIQLDVVRSFYAAILAVLIVSPLIMYFVNVPHQSFSFSAYREMRSWTGILLDIVAMTGGSLLTAVLVFDVLITFNLLAPIPLASAAGIGVFVGYSIFLWRNRDFYGYLPDIKV